MSNRKLTEWISKILRVWICNKLLPIINLVSSTIRNSTRTKTRIINNFKINNNKCKGVMVTIKTQAGEEWCKILLMNRINKSVPSSASVAPGSTMTGRFSNMLTTVRLCSTHTACWSSLSYNSSTKQAKLKIKRVHSYEWISTPCLILSEQI